MAAAAYLVLGIVAWIGALAAPLFLASWFWNNAPKHMGRWSAHLMFAPILALAEWLLVSLLFFAAHDDGEGPPGLGLALIPPALLFVGALTLYYVGVAWACAGKLRSPSPDRQP